jgi:aconitate hydratase
MKVLLENLLRFEDGVTVTRDDLQAMVDWQKERRSTARSSTARRAC